MNKMLVSYLLDNPQITILSASVGLLVALVFQLVKFYSNVKSLPPGPFPWPLLGNMMVLFKKDERLAHEIMFESCKQFGPVFTFWFGPLPQVMVNDPKIAKEALTRIEFAGRPDFGVLSEVLFEKGSTDIVMSDFNREWEVLRKVAHTAVRKFAVTERLPVIIQKKMKEFLQEIKEQNGDQPFDPSDYISFLMLSLLSTIAFGKEFKMTDPDFQMLNDALKSQTENSSRVVLLVFLPMLRYVFRKEYEGTVHLANLQRNYAKTQYKEHQATYTDGVIRDFTDAMIFAKTLTIRNI